MEHFGVLKRETPYTDLINLSCLCLLPPTFEQRQTLLSFFNCLLLLCRLPVMEWATLWSCLRSCLCKWKASQAILGKGWDERYACSAGFTGRTLHYSSIIEYLLSLHGTKMAVFVIIINVCFDYHMLSFFLCKKFKKNHKNNFSNWGMCPGREVLWIHYLC